MSAQRSFSRSAKIYFSVVIAAGAAVTAHSAQDLFLHPAPIRWLILAALTLLTGTFTVKIPSLSARISVSEAFVFASVLLFGPSVATVIVALDCAVVSFWTPARNRSTIRTLFNISAVASAIWIAAHVFYLLMGRSPGSVALLNLTELAWPLLVLAVLYFLLNSWLIAIAVAAERRQPVVALWRHNFAWLSLNYFGGASVAALLVAYTRSVDLGALGIIIPLLVISYLTYRTSLGRVEDAKRHIEQVDALYLSTIEALAMAVDAKDQITHGHIRRVQVYAVELARRLGVTDEQQIKSIEAAALLHDMGKLAIPEHILNKPGKLTHGEFEKMKRHADIGADLLSSIPFPYPVVPIVRHHHENWDGTGYPTGISGTDIPLGARILSVVDCFDALTSDRPYRPKLSDSAAFDILQERRGSMYDPLVVDTFVQAHSEISPAAIQAGQNARTLLTGNLGAPTETGEALNAIHSEAILARALVELRRSLNRARSTSDVVEAVAQSARQVTPATVIALYLYVPQRDVVRCAHAAGDTEGLLRGIEIHSGERTTGWAAANKRIITNSSAALDLPYVRDRFTPALESTMSVPVCVSGALRGVLTLYSNIDSPYTASHEYFCEQIELLLGDHLASGDSQTGVVPFPQRAEAIRK